MYMTQLYKLLQRFIVGISLALFLFVPTIASAQMQQANPDPGVPLAPALPVVPVVPTNTPSNNTTQQANTPQVPTVKLFNPIKKVKEMKNGVLVERDATIPEIIGRGIQVALGILGSLSFLAVFFGFFTMMTSAGASDQIQRGKRTMIYAGIGLFVILSAYAVLSYIIRGLTI